MPLCLLYLYRKCPLWHTIQYAAETVWRRVYGLTVLNAAIQIFYFNFFYLNFFYILVRFFLSKLNQLQYNMTTFTYLMLIDEMSKCGRNYIVFGVILISKISPLY